MLIELTRGDWTELLVALKVLAGRHGRNADVVSSTEQLMRSGKAFPPGESGDRPRLGPSPSRIQPPRASQEGERWDRHRQGFRIRLRVRSGGHQVLEPPAWDLATQAAGAEWGCALDHHDSSPTGQEAAL